MDANEVVKEWKYLVNCWLLQGIEPGASAVGGRDHNHLTTHQLCFQNYSCFCIPVRADDAVKLSSKVIKMEEKIKEKRGGWVVRDTMKMA